MFPHNARGLPTSRQVRLPMSKIGLELAASLSNLGIIDSFACMQRHSKVRCGAEAIVWSIESAGSVHWQHHSHVGCCRHWHCGL